MSASPLYSSSQTVTIALNNIADGAEASSSEIDNSTNLFLEDDLEVNLAGGNAGETGRVSIHMLRGNAAGVLETTDNATQIGSVTLNGVSAVRKVIRVSNIPKFYKIRAVHASSGAYSLGASGNSMSFLGINIQDV